jgi:6,7-dimethyl-8-ribityllumazine synthase
MSSRDIDSTSENVLHDWAREEPEESEESEGTGQADLEAESLEQDDEDAPAWGTTSTMSEHDDHSASIAVGTETAAEVVSDLEPDAELALDEELDEQLQEGEVEIDETPMHVELSQEHAAGDLHIPDGYAVLEGVAEGGRRAVGIVVSRFNGDVTSQLLDSALGELSTAGVRQEAITIMVVPGAFELPLAATALAKTRRFACIVALGCVIRGDTPHFDYVSSEAASGLQLAALETGVPVAFGVLTLDRVEQAEARVGKGAEAVRSALEMADLFAHLRAAAAR